MQHLLNDLVGHGGNVGTGQRAVGHMDGVADAGGDDLGVDVGVVQEHIMDGLNQVDAGLADVIQTAEEGADIGGTGAGGQQCLIGAENQGAVGGDTLRREDLDGFEAFGRHGDLDNHVLGIERVDGAALGDHPLGVCGRGLDLTGDGAVHDRGDLLQGLGIVAALLCDQAGVGGHACDNAHVICLANLVHIGGVDIELHRTLLL